MVDKGGASFFASIGFDGATAGRFTVGGGADGRGAGGTSSWLRLLKILIRAVLPSNNGGTLRCYVLLVYRAFQKKGKPFLGYRRIFQA
jgi:hypothetical protein